MEMSILVYVRPGNRLLVKFSVVKMFVRRTVLEEMSVRVIVRRGYLLESNK